MSGQEKGRRSARKGSEKILKRRCVPDGRGRGVRRASGRPVVTAARRSAEDLSESRVEGAQRGGAGRPGTMRGVGAGFFERSRRHMHARVRHRVRERRLLREEQQEYATKLLQGAQGKAVRHGAEKLLGDEDRVGEAVVQSHRIVFQDNQLAGDDDRLEAVLHRRFRLDLHELVGAAR